MRVVLYIYIGMESSCCPVFVKYSMGTSCFVVKSISVTSIQVSYIYIDNYLLGSLFCMYPILAPSERRKEKEK